MEQPEQMKAYLHLIEEQRRTYRNSFSRNSSEKDKTVVAVSGVALATSIAFLTDTEASAGWTWLLVLALSAFAVAIVFVLLSYHFNSGQLDRSIRNIDKWMEAPNLLTPPEDGTYMVTIGRFSIRVMDILNAVSVFSLIAGVALVIGFVSLNI